MGSQVQRQYYPRMIQYGCIRTLQRWMVYRTDEQKSWPDLARTVQVPVGYPPVEVRVLSTAPYLTNETLLRKGFLFCVFTLE